MTTPRSIWTAELEQTISQPPLVLGDTLLLAVQPPGRISQHSGLLALDLGTGQKRWQHDFNYSLVSGMLAYRLEAEGQAIAIVAASSSDLLQGEGGLLAFNEAGEIVWRWQAKEQHYGGPVVADRKVIVVAGSKTFISISPESGGNDVQRIPLEVTASISPPAIAAGAAYIPCRGPELLSVKLNGEVRWHFQFQGGKRDWLDKTPAVAERRVFAVSSQGSVFALDRDSGKLVWQTAVGEKRPLSQPLVHDDHLYLGFEKGLTALDTKNGRSLWTFPTTRPVSAPPLILGDTIYLASEDHRLYALELETGLERWHHESSRRIEMPPVLAPNALIVADRGGLVIALERPSFSAHVREPDMEQIASNQARLENAQHLEEQGQLLKAAAIWHEQGELERAAQLYEKGEAWLEAAQLWQQLDRYGKRAEAYERRARQLVADSSIEDEEKAAAWEHAARAFAETGQKEARQNCEREAARFRRHPILTIELKPEGKMVLNAWGRVIFMVHNEGFGTARRLSVSLMGDRFDGQAAHTQTIVNLPPNRDYSHWLDVSPQAHGSSVPMQLVIEYLDKNNSIHKLERTFYLDVAEDEELPATAPLPPATSTDSREILATIEASDGRDLFALRNQIVESFNKDEMLDVLFQLGLREDDFDERLSSMVRELIVYVVQNGRLDELLAICQERRPNIEW